jgi:hypothetical protein
VIPCQLLYVSSGRQKLLLYSGYQPEKDILELDACRQTWMLSWSIQIMRERIRENVSKENFNAGLS